MKNREHFDKNYADAKEAIQKLSYEDELNLLYVAFTRAKESLTICQKEEKSSFEILNLNAFEVGQINPSEIKQEIKEVQKFEYEESSFGAQEKKNRPEKIDNINIEARHFGLGLHYMLEIIEDFDLKYIESAYWAMKNRYEIFLDPNSPNEIKERIIKLLEHEPFLKLTNGKILKEQPISYNGELKIIDLFVEHENHFVIIDYKSSQKQQSEHVKQVLSYKNAIQKIVDKDVIAYLCYLRKEEIELVII
jgi:ATP-dependent exoDNAse (exonuclease V) beta subunit